MVHVRGAVCQDDFGGAGVNEIKVPLQEVVIRATETFAQAREIEKRVGQLSGRQAGTA